MLPPSAAIPPDNAWMIPGWSTAANRTTYRATVTTAPAQDRIRGSFELRRSPSHADPRRANAYVDRWQVGGAAGDEKDNILLMGEDGVLVLVHEVWGKGDKEVVTKRLGFYRWEAGRSSSATSPT